MNSSSIFIASFFLWFATTPCVSGQTRSGHTNSPASQLIGLEMQSWEAVKQKDYKKFASFIADDFLDIFSNGQAVTKRELLEKYIRGVDLIDYSLSKFRVVMLDKGAYVVVYEAVAHGAENQSMAHDIKKGEVSAIHVAVTSAWAKRNGRWLNVFYRENDIK
jgi:hypothetical protein